MEIEIRDTRNGEWHWVYNSVIADPHLSTSEKLVYSAISSFGGHQIIKPTVGQISDRCGLSERAIQLGVQTLVDVGFLRVEKVAGKPNIYFLLKASKGCTKCANRGVQNTQGVQNTTERGANSSIRSLDKDKKDIRIEVEIEDKEPRTRVKADTSYKTIFSLWGSYPLSWNRDNTQKQSAKALLREKGLKQVKAAVAFYKDNSDEKFIPKIRSPRDLDTKWENLLDYKEKNV